jgi:DNA-binding transcriptional regulator YdaS (Cro superfamily)
MSTQGLLEAFMLLIEKAVSEFSTKAEFCRAVGMKEQFLTNILNGTKKISPRYALAIENVTDKRITRQQLRPDIYPD